MSYASGFIYGNDVLDASVVSTSVAAAVLYGLSVRSPPSHWRTTTKTISTALLSLAAALRGGPALLTSALAFGAIGDAFLASDDGDTAFLAGLSSFLIAHIFYACLFFQCGSISILDDRLRSTLALGMLLLAPVMLIILTPRVDSRLRLPVISYSSVILTMVLLALRLENNRVVGGAVLFAASDSILSADRFLMPAASWHRGWMQHTVWILYYVGQALIAMGVLETGI